MTRHLIAIQRNTLCFTLTTLMLLSAVVCAQNPSPVQPKPEERTAVIRFFSDVNPGTIGMLLQTIDAQYKLGTRKFTILMSSGGGDVLSGFMAYNYLRGLPIEVTTFNVGNVDSAASIIYCAGSKRYAVPEARFIIHEVSLSFTANGPGLMSIDLPSLEAQISLLKSQEMSMARIFASAIGKPQPQGEKEAEARIHAQASLSSEEARKWGLVQDIKTVLFDPNNSTLVSTIVPPTPINPPNLTSQPNPTAPVLLQFSYTGTPLLPQ